MPMVSMTLKVHKGQLQALKAVARERRIPQSELVRQGIEKVIHESREPAVTPELRQWLDRSFTKNDALMKELADL